MTTPETETLIELLRDLVDGGDCWFDHNGGCQAHGYLWLEQGQVCPHAEAKEIISNWDTEHPETEAADPTGVQP
jgi:hypothetical protein